MSGRSAGGRARAVGGVLLERRHSALLVALVLTFAVRPLFGDTGVAQVATSLALVTMLLVALYTIEVDERIANRADRRPTGWTTALGWMLASVAVVERIEIVFLPSRFLALAGTISWLLLLVFVAWSEFRSVLRDEDVTGETISKSVSIYLLIGLCWGLLYGLIFELDPGAFNLGAAAPVGGSNRNLFPTFVYFSLTTLSTIGYGDITPLSLQARYLAVAEGITGQFYLAVLVARLVAMQMNRSATRSPGHDLQDRGSGRDPEK